MEAALIFLGLLVGHRIAQGNALITIVGTTTHKMEGKISLEVTSMVGPLSNFERVEVWAEVAGLMAMETVEEDGKFSHRM